MYKYLVRTCYTHSKFTVCCPSRYQAFLSCLYCRSFSWRRNGKYFNVARDQQTSMRRRSGTLDINAWNNPEDYEGEYQCIASNEYGSAYSNKIVLRLSSKLKMNLIHNLGILRGIYSRKVSYLVPSYVLVRGSPVAQRGAGACGGQCGSSSGAVL